MTEQTFDQEKLKKTEALLEELYAYSMHGIKLGLENIRKICGELGNPQDSFKIIHVAGTNGKGSVTAAIANCLQAAGYHTGRYISPHILRFNERISLDGRDIGDEEIACYYELTKKAIARAGVHPTFFEVTTAMMFRYFADAGAEYVVLETGMGGRFDATNICDDLICVITNVSLEHTEYLGNTIAEITREKAGIIKNCENVVVGDNNPDFLRVVRVHMPQGFAPTNVLEKYKNASYHLDYERFHTLVTIDDKTWDFALFGDYQFQNFLCAYEALRLLPVGEAALRKGFAGVRWECRFEVWSRQPLVILDGAHNEAGMAELAKIIRKAYRREDTVILTSILRDKNIEKMTEILDSLADTIIFTEISHNPRGLKGEEIRERAAGRKEEYIVEDNLEKAWRIAREKGKKLTLICGSFYLLSEFKEKYRP
ncbi:MAG: bifunctional folylpolyglutamate synthase/dihydrofolate synthase [Fusobacteriaceae bacterium]|nr:bifunctional folylpolyglutamate synthase/dihydrofolate synthase [Fusobacteriaceae bacterium]